MPLRSVGGVLISLSVATEYVGGATTKAYITMRFDYDTTTTRLRGKIVVGS